MRGLLQARRAALGGSCAPRSLHTACAARASVDARRRCRRWPRVRAGRGVAARGWRRSPLPRRWCSASGAAFLYRATERSSSLLAAELATDHLKCFAMNAVVGLAHPPHVVEQSMASGFGWQMHVPAAGDDLELVGSRPCLYARGKIAHIMYRHHGEPVSLYMLPKLERPETLVGALGHECAIWSRDERTFVLVARTSRAEVERLAGVMQASLR